MRWRVLRILFLIYVAWGVFALLLVPLSALGIIATNPLAAILALVLGLPWSVLLTWWIDTSIGFFNFLLLIVAIAINAAILRFIARRPAPEPEDEGEDEDEDEFDETEDEEDDAPDAMPAHRPAETDEDDEGWEYWHENQRDDEPPRRR
ncbi:MAG: hypothetical protein ABS35_13785 [Kaistia sp. SCN 65-12]|nr:MAG: hypothetical protein ABS35_13785 [Kaistia sp. SCN 65-12]